MPAALLSTALGFTLSNFIQPALTPVSDMLQQAAYSILPYRPLDPSTAIEAHRKGIISSKLFHEYMKRQGYSETASNRMFDASKTVMQANELITAKWRGVITEKQFLEMGAKAGYDKEILENVEKISKFYPSPQDFIRFMVRETFDDAISYKYGYDKDYPKQINEFVQKAGLDPEWMKHFWRSHWELPSVMQGYQMMHRGEITKEELNDLLRIGDIPKYWREKLINISYNLYTRVDARRMHKEGVLSDEEVFKAYKDLGYDDEKAANMTAFTIKYNLEEPKKIAEGKIQESYMSGKIADDVTLTMLKSLGYDDTGAKFIIEIWKNDLSDIDTNMQIDILKRDYLFGDIDEATMTANLGRLNLPRKSMDIIRNQVELDRSLMRKMPTKGDFTRWFNSKIIDEAGYRTHLEKMGYGKIFIDNYIKDTHIGGSEEFRLPTKKEILNWFKKDIINLENWVSLMFGLGYSNENIIRYAEDYKINLEAITGVPEEVENGLSTEES